MKDERNRDALALLAAIESVGRLRPRDRLALGLGNQEQKGVNILYEATICGLENGQEGFSIRCLEALAELCQEVECAELLGMIGGHALILGIMSDMDKFFGGRAPRRGIARKLENGVCEAGEESTANLSSTRGKAREGREVQPDTEGSDASEGEEDEVQAAAAKVAARVASSGCAFPMRTASLVGDSSSLGRYPLRYTFSCDGDLRSREDDRESRSDVHVDVSGRCTAGPPALAVAGECRPIEVFIRTVKQRQHSQFDVGFQMWPAAVILSRWMCANSEAVRGRQVLEVGAGLGLCGLVASHMAHSVTLSDFNPIVLKALEANVALNANWTTPDGRPDGSREAENVPGQAGRALAVEAPREKASVAIDVPGMVQVRHLDWDNLDVSGTWPCCRDIEHAKGLSGASAYAASADECGSDEAEVSGEHGDFDTVKRGKRFDVVIASDHICQESDAEGTIRVLRALLARDGDAHFLVAHPRTRYGVDALVPLLQKCPEFAFTCREVLDAELLQGLEEAEFLAWLQVHVWWADREASTALASESREFEAEAGRALLVSG